MSSDLSTYLGNRLIRYLAGNAMPTPPASIYMSLHSANPKSGGTEVTTQVRSAGRVAVTWTAPSAGSVNSMPNAADVDFGNSENDVSLSHAGFYDASSGGNLLFSKPVPGGPVAVSAGNGVRFNGGDITVTAGSAT